MHERDLPFDDCVARRDFPPGQRERGIRIVILLTAVVMVAEIVVGYTTGSMALLAEGWHMATHVGALGLASVADSLSRRFARHRIRSRHPEGAPAKERI